ncbi:hypothetical protein DDZ15_13480 [Rhodohalobacter mucosus]|uniref:MSHA pilin protein MshD n=2 Tax=Rhodohalobacter mucosus TaxID=2079485 RepID=A0A316TTJ1_9BACT|nr:hypothetical protein DDZ15_13480 [Rhodohalobacter mucosus]
MIIFSMILLSANSMIHRNSMLQIDGELEQEVISLGQEIIEEARSKSFDNVTVNSSAPPAIIPGGFTAAGSLGADSGEGTRTAFDDFDDYDGWSTVMTTTHGDFDISVDVFYVDGTNFQPLGAPSTFKKIEVTVTSAFLREDDAPRQYVLEFIRNYYAD